MCECDGETESCRRVKYLHSLVSMSIPIKEFLEFPVAANGSFSASSISLGGAGPGFEALLPATDCVVIHAENDRKDLKHTALKAFIGNTSGSISELTDGKLLALSMPPGPENAIALLTALCTGSVAPIDWNSTEEEAEVILRALEADKVLTRRDNVNLIKAASALSVGVIFVEQDTTTVGLFTLDTNNCVRNDSSENQHDGVALILHTSGTSGNKKQVYHTAESLLVGTACIIKSWGLTPSDCNLNMMPLFHVGGICRGVLAPILSGGSITLTLPTNP